MQRSLILVAVALVTVVAVEVGAALAGAPAGATAQCRDGSYSYSQSHSGTCSHHGGVAKWLDGSSSAGSSGSTETEQTSGACGVERWTVKTLQDRPVLLPVRVSTVAALGSLPAPSPLPSTRLPFERRVFRVTAAVTLVRKEADSDFHLVLQDGAGRTMIAEAPLPSCAPLATAARRTQMGTARAAVRLCPKATVTGVAFFDFKHGQTGVAPNAIELHPILAFRCLSG
jgi:hypothetical protein